MADEVALHMMDLATYLASLPKEWHVVIEQPVEGFRGKEKYINENGKEKWRELRYTVYVSNGELFAMKDAEHDKFYARGFVDGNDPVQALNDAIVQMKATEQQLREEYKKLKQKAKKK